MRSRTFLLFAIVSIVVVFVAELPLEAQGARGQLSGTYSFTGEQACLVSPLGFNANLTPAGAGASVQSASTHGTMKFNADGTGTAEFRELLIVHPPASPLAASSQEASFSFTYNIADDGEMTLVIGTVSGSFLAGPFTGLTFTNTPPPMIGQVARNGAVVTLTTVDPAVETSTLGPPASITIPRICHRSRVLVPVHVGSED